MENLITRSKGTFITPNDVDKINLQGDECRLTRFESRAQGFGIHYFFNGNIFEYKNRTTVLEKYYDEEYEPAEIIVGSIPIRDDALRSYQI
jgi:hypothetical protein